MALVYEKNHNFIAKIGDKKIKYRPWTTLEEKEYLLASSDEADLNDQEIYDLLIKPCLEDKDIILSNNEQRILMIEIRKQSIGTTLPANFSCQNPECLAINTLEIDLDEMTHFKPEKWEEVEIEDIKFIFGSIQSQALKDRLNNTENEVDKVFMEFLVHIKALVIKGKLENTFKFEELERYVYSLPVYIFDEAYKEFKKQRSSLKFNYETSCFKCGQKAEIDFEYLPNFLWT